MDPSEGLVVAPLLDGRACLAGQEEKKDSVMDSDNKQRATESAAIVVSHRKSYSEASDVTINITQETDATSPLTPDPDNRKTPEDLPVKEVHYHQHEDEDSSNDGSYFVDPVNLPSPKSDRRYSSSSKLLPPGLEYSNNKESDASLSLSDDSEDRHHKHDLARHPESDHRVDLYPQQLTRMHSISSLVSGSSNHSSYADEIVPEEIDSEPSGRISPVLGKHQPRQTSATADPSPASQHNTQPSPPTILSSYQQQQPTKAYIHPQPHLLNAASVMTAPWISPPQLPARVQFSFSSPSTTSVSMAGTPTIGSSGSKSSGLVYSEDSDSMPHHSFAQVPQKGGAVSVPGQRQSARTTGFYQNYGQQSGLRQFSNSLDGDTIDELEEENAMNKASPVYSGPGSTGRSPSDEDSSQDGGFRVYWQRWLMLMYMSILNLLSDWTCYSVAPIAVLTEEAFGRINSEQLVVLFLAANAVATACEPILLSRLGLRKTVLFGALLLMIGSIIKSGGMPPIIEPHLEKGHGEWRVYLGFFLVGLSQPLYQCTPALLSASWFPEKERTLATGVALNANQVGIGFAFVFGTLLVKTSDDIVSYFGLLSILSTLTFLGTLVHFDDAPPTPPSNTARVMRGTLEVNLPSIKNIFESVRNMGPTKSIGLNLSESATGDEDVLKPFMTKCNEDEIVDGSSRKSGEGSPSSTNRIDVIGSANSVWRDRSIPHHSTTPSEDVPLDESAIIEAAHGPTGARDDDAARSYQFPSAANWDDGVQEGFPAGMHEFGTASGSSELPAGGYPPPTIEYGSGLYMPYPQYHPVWDAQSGQFVYYPVPMQQSTGVLNPLQHYGRPGLLANNNFGSVRYYDSPYAVLPLLGENEEGIEPVLTLTPHRLDINIRDDQVWLSIKACMARPGFIHSLVSFTVSGIVINTLSTFMDYLVRLNGAGREYTGIVGGSFQFVIMISSLVMGQFTDRTRAYYSIIVGMLVLGAFGLAECGVNLDADKGVELRISLVIVAALVGPLQPVSTELGVETAYPLSENTVLVIQQLFANLLSACFIPCFKAFKTFELSPIEDADQAGHPQFTFSFYVLIVLHAVATVFFATFNGRYLRFEHEEEKKEIERYKQEQKRTMGYGSFGSPRVREMTNDTLFDETNPLMP